MTRSAFQVKEVIQFTFTTNNKKAGCILADIANLNASESHRTNIRASLQILLKNGDILFKIVPGTSVGLPFQKTKQTPEDLHHVRQVLRKYCIKFCEERVIFVNVSSIPGQLSLIQSVFNHYGIQIIASYIDESTFSIFQIPANKIRLAVQILTKNTLAQLEEIRDDQLHECRAAVNCKLCSPEHKYKCHCTIKKCHIKKSCCYNEEDC